MFTYIVKKHWEFQAENFEEAKKVAGEIVTIVPDEVMLASEEIITEEDSLNEHWEKKRDAAY